MPALVHLQISMSYWHQRRYDESIGWANKALALDPRHPHAREHLAGAYLKKGDFDRYLAENITHAKAHGVPASAFEPLERAYAAAGIVLLAVAPRWDTLRGDPRFHGCLARLGLPVLDYKATTE